MDINKLRELIYFLIPTDDDNDAVCVKQKETSSLNKTQRDKLYFNIMNKRIYTFNKARLAAIPLILRGLRGEKRNRFNRNVNFVKDLMKKENRLKIVIKKMEKLNKQIKNLDQERRAIKLFLDMEYSEILKNIKTGSNIGLDYMVYNMKNDTANEEEYHFKKNMYGKKRVRNYYAKNKPEELNKNF